MPNDSNGYGPNRNIAQVFITSITPPGGAPTNPMMLVSQNNGILGGWAIVSDRFATYNPTLGLGPLAFPGFSAQSAATLFTAGPTDNVDASQHPERHHPHDQFTAARHHNTSITMASATDRLTIGSGGVIMWEREHNHGRRANDRRSAGPMPPPSCSCTSITTVYLGTQVVDNGSSPRHAGPRHRPARHTATSTCGRTTNTAAARSSTPARCSSTPRRPAS